MKSWRLRNFIRKNPYVLSGTPCSSNSGSAISVDANLVMVLLGAETHGSILCSSSHKSVVGIKPICRTVSDVVYGIDAIVGFDELDAEATKAAEKFIPDGFRHPFFSFPQGSNISQVFEGHFDTRGAVLVDNLEIEHIDIITNPSHSGELTVAKAEFKQSLNIYLKELITSPVRSLANVIAFNKNHKDLEKVDEFPQDMLLAAEKTHGMGGEEERLMMENELDAIVTPGSDFAAVLAIGGYPGISVASTYDEDNDGGTEPKLIEIAYTFEQATLIRRPPLLKINLRR
ncbi:hypothetical protein MKX01_011207 [Papaver californicum]|nr:hypothetical protein MKX01_011207 [Papaver californicum]